MLKRCIAGCALAVAMMAPAAFAQTEIVWWHAMGGQLGEQVVAISQGFNEMQDDYEVVPVYKGTYAEAMTTSIAAFRAGDPPHIVQVYEVGTATMMAAEGAIYPVHQLMEEFGLDFDQADYLPAVISYYVSAEGDLLSLPFNSSTPVLWYNQTALDEIGHEVPTTWIELEEASRAAVEAGYPCGFSFGWQSWVMLENYSAWHNLPFASNENGYTGLDTEFLFNNQAVVNRIQTIAELGEEGIFQYGGRQGDSLPLFINQECVFWMNSSAYYGGINADAEFEFGQTMLPLDTEIPPSVAVVTEPQNSIIGGATLWTLRGHEQSEYEGVGRFFQYLSSPEVQARWHQNTGYVPITTAAYELSQQEGFYEANPGTDTAIRQLSLNEPTANSRGLRLGNFVQIRDAFNEELEAVWAGQKTAQQALDSAVQRGNDLLRQFAARAQ